MTTKTSLTLLLFIAVRLLNAQSTTEIQMKNGLVYYTFHNKLNNTKKCLSTYLSPSNMMEMTKKTNSKSIECSTNKSKPFFGKNYTFMVGAGFSTGKCNDTTKAGQVNIGLPVKITPTRLYELGKQKLISQSVEAKIEIVFVAKDEYILKIKGFTYKNMSKSATKVTTGEHPLGEMYQDYLNDESKSKEQTNMYNDINSMVNEVDRIIRESLTEMYKVDELD